MSEPLIFHLESLWFDLNYGGLAVSETEFYNWSYEKLRFVNDRFLAQKKLEEQEIKSKTKH